MAESRKCQQSGVEHIIYAEVMLWEIPIRLSLYSGLHYVKFCKTETCHILAQKCQSLICSLCPAVMLAYSLGQLIWLILTGDTRRRRLLHCTLHLLRWIAVSKGKPKLHRLKADRSRYIMCLLPFTRCIYCIGSPLQWEKLNCTVLGRANISFR